MKSKEKKDTLRPSAMPGPRKDLEEVRLALSKLDLKTSGNPTLHHSHKHRHKRKVSNFRKETNHNVQDVKIR